MARIELGNQSAKHLFEVDTDKGKIDVYADTRAKAGVIARKAGYAVRSINMVG